MQDRKGKAERKRSQRCWWRLIGNGRLEGSWLKSVREISIVFCFIDQVSVDSVWNRVDNDGTK